MFISIGMAVVYVVKSINSNKQILWALQNIIRFDMGSVV